MGLLAPLFLIGAAAIALPIWLHRLKTQSSDRQPFSSAMLLETTEQQVHVQKKLKYLLLLAFRIAMLAILAFAFAKPFFEAAPAPAAARDAGSHVVVLDTSTSMGRSGVFAQARAEAVRAIDDAPDGAVIQILAADGLLRVVRPASPDKSVQRAAVAGVEVSAERLGFGQLMSEIERYARTLPAPTTLHLISDFQESGMPVQFADVVPNGIARLVPHPVGTGEPVNWSIEFVRQTADGMDVSVRNQGMSNRTVDVQLDIDGERAGTLSATGPGQYLLSFTGIEFEEGDHRVVVTLDTDDDLEADNRWHAVVSVEPPQPVPLLTTNPDGLPVTYLRAALESVTGGRYSVLPLVPGDFDPRVLTRYSWLIIDDIGLVDPLLAEQLETFVAPGGNVLAFAADRTLSLQTLPLTGHPLGAASLGSGAAAFASIGRIDLQHPALAATDGWHRVNVARAVPVVPGAEDQVLMSLENGEPLILEQARGAGRVVIVASGIDNRWNDLPVHPVFVGFMAEVAGYLSGRVTVAGSYTTGGTLPLSLIGSTAGQVIDPDGESVLSLADTARAQMIRLDKPGIYEVYTPEGETLVATNIDPRESDLVRIADATLDRWRDATYSTDEAVATAAAGATPSQVALWPWLLLVLAVVAIAESALGNVHISTGTRAVSTTGAGTAQ